MFTIRQCSIPKKRNHTRLKKVLDLRYKEKQDKDKWKNSQKGDKIPIKTLADKEKSKIRAEKV